MKKYNVKDVKVDVMDPEMQPWVRLFKVRMTPMVFLVEHLPDGKRRVLKRWGGPGYRLLTEEQWKKFVNPKDPWPRPAVEKSDDR